MNFLTILKLKLQGRTWKVDGLRIIDETHRKQYLIVIKK